MREIKYRVFDKGKKDDKSYNERMSKPFFLFEEWVSFDDGDMIPIQFIKDGDRFCAMQHTGLKDKNGVEIYEGDLIRFGENKNPTEVRYCVETGSYVLFFKDGSTVDLFNREYAYEVIGNIYENEELLK